MSEVTQINVPNEQLVFAVGDQLCVALQVFPTTLP
jgi:hypothetical protein